MVQLTFYWFIHPKKKKKNILLVKFWSKLCADFMLNLRAAGFWVYSTWIFQELGATMSWTEPPDPHVWLRLGSQRKWFLFDTQRYSLYRYMTKMMVVDNGKHFPKKSGCWNREVMKVDGMTLSKNVFQPCNQNSIYPFGL